MADENENKTAEEGFDLGAALDGVRQAAKEVRIYLDAAAADEAFRLNGALLEARAESKDVPAEALSITEEPAAVRLERKLKEAVAALNEHSMVFHLRALAGKEMDVIRNTVVNKVKMPRGLSDEAQAEFRRDRQGVLNEYFLSHSVTGIDYQGKHLPGLSLSDARRLRETLPATEWDKLTETFLEAQAALDAMRQVMADPTFRWALSDDA